MNSKITSIVHTETIVLTNMHHRLSLLSDPLLPFHLRCSVAVTLTGAFFTGIRTPRSKNPKVDRHPPKPITPLSEGSSAAVSEMAYGTVVPLLGHCIRISYYCHSASMHAPSPIFYELGIKTTFCTFLTEEMTATIIKCSR